MNSKALTLEVESPLAVEVAGDDETTAIKNLVAAFAADPAARWLYPEDARYHAHFPRFVLLFGGQAFACRTAVHTTDSRAAALWLPPGTSPEEEPLIEHLRSSIAPARHDEIFALFERMSELHPAEPHWYLPLIGVAPAAQGGGRGAALLRWGLERCDRDGLPAYLEASNLRNQRLYERHGFRARGVIQAAGSPPIIAMWRPAR